MITIVAHCIIKKESVDEFLKCTQPLLEGSKKEAGNVVYDLYADMSAPDKFTFIEVWKDQKAIDEHNASAHFQAFVAAAGPLFAGDLDIRHYKQLSS
jgi:quinol monooxygenase YgiN